MPPCRQLGPASMALPGELGLTLGKRQELLPLLAAGGACSRLAWGVLGHCMVLHSWEGDGARGGMQEPRAAGGEGARRMEGTEQDVRGAASPRQ